MDTLKITIEQGEIYPGQPFPQVNIFINGRNLIEIVRDEEISLNFKPRELAGSYEGLDLGTFQHTNKNSHLGLTVLQCECGQIGCWDMHVKVTADKDTVMWSDFSNPHRGPDSPAGHWVYALKFIFDRRQYEAELSKCGIKFNE
jgi:hypothetical protein